ncbi:MAG: methyl-accepting chemotaxis protein [Gammaproteobacteria bacterium]|nr:methyl-accepting chemotaxis protein [Gammaproteobacteria bacterium]
MRMTVGRKLSLVNALMFAVLLLAGISGIWGIKNLSENLAFISGPAWDAADGAMETVITLQEEMILMEEAIDENKPITIPQEIKDARDEAIGRMWGSGLMKSELKAPFDEALSQYKKSRNVILKAAENHAVTDEMVVQYKSNVDVLLNQLEALEKNGDGAVEGMTEAIERVESLSYSAMFGALLLGVVIVMFSMFYTRRAVVDPIKNLADRLEDVASGNGDLTLKLEEKGDDELTDVARRFNRFLGKLRGMMEQIKGSVATIESGAADFSVITDELKNNAMRQQQETQTIAAAVNEMAASIREVAENANAASAAADTADKEAINGRQVVKSSVNAVEGLAAEVARSATVLSELDAHSQRIESVLDVIKTIAEQTNLLALNAAIEAARAGEQGRGFAVVADEVRTLASRTQESTQEIQVMIAALQASSKQAVSSMHDGNERARQAMEEVSKANDALESIASCIQDIVGRNVQIAAAAEEQSSVADEINRNVENISVVSSETGRHAENTANGSAELNQMAKSISGLVAQFRT